MAVIDLSQLPPPQIVDEPDFETLLTERKAEFVALYPAEEQEAVARTLTLESEPIVKTLQENVYRELLLRQRINEAAKAVMVAYSGGDDLDNLGANNNVQRRVITAADDTTTPPTEAVMESDADYRQRIPAAFEGMRVAGPVGAYEYHALSSDGRVGDLASALDGFVKRHPQLTAALFKIAAVFAIVATAAGVLSLALASILGPMAIVRVSAGVLGLKFSSAFALITKVISGTGQAILWLGRLMMANPILAIIGLIAMGAIYIWQNWETLGPKFKALCDAISSGVSGAWAVIKQTISNKWDEILNDVAALPAKFKEVGGAIIDGILSGINEKWETLKSKLASVKSYLPDWMTGGDKSPGATQQKGAGGFFAGMYDSGGYIPRGQVGIAGENGPELINGPAYVTSRRRTAALASVVAGMMGGAMPAEAAPLHPMSLPAASYRPAAEKPAGTQPVFQFETQAQIIIHAQPGQSPQDIAREVARQLDERERRMRAKARSSFSDQGGYD